MHTLEENINQASADFNRIKDKIVECGVDVPTDTSTSDYAAKVGAVYNKAYGEGKEAGQQSEYDSFWDGMQDYGNRTNYQYGFTFWKSRKINPKHIIKSDTLYGIFYGCSNLEELPSFVSTNEAGFASAMMAFMNCILIKKVPPFKIKTSGFTYLNNTFSNCKALETIEELAFADGEYAFQDTFKSCNELKNLTIKGTIQSNGFNLQWSTLLSKASITNIINCLSATTTGLTVTLSKAAVNEAFRVSPGVADGASSTEWLNLVATKPNWTISLV